MTSIESFVDLVRLSEDQTHSLLRRLDQMDVKLAVNGEDEPARQVKEKLFGAMSERARRSMQEELGRMQFNDLETQNARDRLLEIVSVQSRTVGSVV